MASGTAGGREYSLVELFAMKFVLADVLIIALLLLAGPIYAILATAVIVLGGLLLWYLAEGGSDESADAESSASAAESEAAATEIDPVTTLQERYAAGELSDAEFEAKLDRLLEADERATDAGVETEELSLERER
ncbi:hypothetical protein A6E15_09305 [Natrinema saccharevitans]|uniref:SHOCT domain-containing protein n=1 Tax=Natrinema saccharevitans TaxID=301967 RepID=A0A1S8AXA6_9EURY|nr:SHOCT domain-containing protein [Natrinema saccharevitans]OLZ41171.1 hypothetical protein A6E15_09305 [Natrinema saccharevitans]